MLRPTTPKYLSLIYPKSAKALNESSARVCVAYQAMMQGYLTRTRAPVSHSSSLLDGPLALLALLA